MTITKIVVTPVNILLETPMFWTGGHIIFLQAI